MAKPVKWLSDMAIEAMKNAIKYEPEFIYHYVQLARAYLNVKEVDKAREVLKKAVELQPVTPDDPENLEICRRLLERMS